MEAGTYDKQEINVYIGSNNKKPNKTQESLSNKKLS